MTIEHYIINRKIERANELIVYDELNLTEISYLLNYSNVNESSLWNCRDHKETTLDLK